MGEMRAVWNGVALAESDETIDLVGVTYFPPDSIRSEHFVSSDLHTTCALKGLASYYDITLNGETKPDRAWYSPQPKPGYENIKDYVAFYGPAEGGVEITTT